MDFLVLCVLFLIIKLRSQYNITTAWSVHGIPVPSLYSRELENTSTISTKVYLIIIVIHTMEFVLLTSQSFYVVKAATRP